MAAISAPAALTPIVRAHLGEPFARVIRASSYPFDPERVASMRDRGHYVVEGRSRLVYDDQELFFEAPPGRFIWISVAAGRVFELAAGLTEEALPLDVAYARAELLAGRLHGDLRLTYLELEEEMAETTRDGYEVDLLRRERGDLRVTLTLRWLGSAAPSERAAYILTATWSNGPLYDELMAKVRAKRREHGNGTTELPLSAWLDEA